MSLGPISKRTDNACAHLYMIFSVSAEPRKRLCGDSLLWGLLQYWFFIKVLSSKKKFSMIIQTCSWKCYEISFAWQHLLRQILMHTSENSSEIILRQTIDLRVKKVISLLNSTTNHWKFLIQLLLGYWLFSIYQERKKMQLQQHCSCCYYTYRSIRFSSINPYCHRFLKSAVVWHPWAQLYFSVWVLTRFIYLNHLGPYSVHNYSPINLNSYHLPEHNLSVPLFAILYEWSC